MCYGLVCSNEKELDDVPGSTVSVVERMNQHESWSKAYPVPSHPARHSALSSPSRSHRLISPYGRPYGSLPDSSG